MAKLQKEFNEATLDARRRVGDLIGSAMRAFDDPKLTNALLAGRLGMLVFPSFCRIVVSGHSCAGLPRNLCPCSASSLRILWVPPRYL